MTKILKNINEIINAPITAVSPLDILMWGG